MTNERNKLEDRLTSQHVEIYGDETRTLEEGITSGLAVCVYPSIDDAEVLQAKLWSEHTTGGVVWSRMLYGGVPKLQKGSEISKNAVECVTQVSLLDDLLSHSHVALGADKRQLWSVVATRVPGAIPEQGLVSLAAFPDGPLDDALRFNLEFALYALIPYFCTGDFTGTVHLYLPSRVLPYDVGQFARELCDAFDLGAPVQRGAPPQWFVPTAALSGDGTLGTAFPLVRGWLHEWQSSSPVPAKQITKIKIETLERGKGAGINSAEAGRRRLFHDIADWACTASGRVHDFLKNQWIWPLNEQLCNKKLFPHWFLSTDGNRDTKNPGKFWYETDRQNSSELMAALKASFRGEFGARGESDALRLMLRNTYIETCDEELFKNAFCAQQRIMLWNIRHEFEYATGRTLHSLVASDSELCEQLGTQHHKEESKSEPLKNHADERPVPETLVENKVFPSESTKASIAIMDRMPVDLSFENSQESTEPTINEPLPDILPEEDLAKRFTGCSYYDVLRATKFGDIFFKLSSDPGSQGTHIAHDREMAFQFRNEGWTQPIVVYATEPPASPTVDQVVGIYTAATARKETPLRVGAAKMADGRWKVIAV